MKNLYLTLILVLTTVLAVAQTTDAGKPTVTKVGAIAASETWTSANNYFLDGRVYVEPGATLTIEPGTVIKGKSSADPSLVGVLIIQAGAKINASGTQELPIIFTSEVEMVSDPSDAPTNEAALGLWGGLVILGKACINPDEGVRNIEGIGVTQADSIRTVYGDVDGPGTCDDADDSGVLRYVSVRHAGQTLVENNELNGITFGGVGSGTVVEYIEVLYNSDDGIEFFGGTFDMKYAIVAFVNDDSYDIDEGFRGKGQFWFALQSSDYTTAERGGEWDGGDSPETGTPLQSLELHNATFIGVNDNEGETNQAIEIRDNNAAKVYNSIFTQFRRGIRLEANTANSSDSYRRFLGGETEFANNLFFNIGTATAPEGVFVSGGDYTASDSTAWVNSFSASGNTIANPEGGFNSLPSVASTPDGTLDPRPSATGPAYTNPTTVSTDPFFTKTGFIGAFEAGTTNWMTGWSGLWSLGYLPSDLTFGVPASIAGFEAIESLRAFPNPTQNVVNVTASNVKSSIAAIYLYDATGREVLRKAVMPVNGELQAEINIAELPAGVYHLQVTNANLAGTATIVKQ
jgi:hypothetical protein